MVENSFLGAAYRCWINSKVFAVLSLIWGGIRNAYDHSVFARFLRHSSKVQQWYEQSLLSRILEAVLNVILKLFSWLCRVFSAPWKSSFFVRICRSSFIINYEFLLGAFICVMFIMPHKVWNNTYALAAAVGFFLLYLLLVASGKREMMYPRELGFPFILFTLVCVLSLLFSHELGDSVRILLIYFAAFLLMFIIAADTADEERLTKLLAFIYAAVFMISCYAIIQRIFNLVAFNASFTDANLNQGVPGRVTSTLDNPNNLSEFLVMFTPLCAVYAGTRKKPLWALLLCLGLCLPALALIMTYSRSGWLSAALAVFIYVWLRNKRLIPALFFVAVLAIPFLPDSVLTRLSTMSGSGDTSVAHRFAIWQGVMGMIRDHGLTGIGLGPDSFAHVYPAYAAPGAKEGAYHTQMQFLEIIVEVGVLGLIAFLWMVLRTVRDAVVSSKRSKGLASLTLVGCVSALLGLTCSCVFEYIWFYPRDMFAYFILLGITLAALRINNGASTESAPQDS